MVDRTNLNPFAILFTQPPSLGIGTPTTRPSLDTNLYKHDILTYCKNLSTLLSDISKQVSAALLVAATDHCTRSNLVMGCGSKNLRRKR